MELEERVELNLLFDKYGSLLSKSQMQTLHLYLIEDLTISEIANELATTRQAVNDAIQKGKNKLLEFHKRIN